MLQLRSVTSSINANWEVSSPSNSNGELSPEGIPGQSGNPFTIVDDEMGYCILPTAPIYLNGSLITSPCPILPGDRIGFGQTLVVFESSDTRVDETFLAERPDPKCYGSVIQLPEDMNVVLGRQVSRQVILLDHPAVSRRHARIDGRRQQVTIVDLGSSNGTYVNGKRIDGKTLLVSGDIVGIGPFVFLFDGQALRSQDVASHQSPAARGQTDVSSTNARLQCRGLTRGLRKNGQKLLVDIDLDVEPGKMVCILGPSGAGKTTLLKALSNREPMDRGWYTNGTVAINGLNLHRYFEQIKHRIAYVPQHEVLFDDLTLRQSLHYTARLRLPADSATHEVNRRMADVLDVVQLTSQADKPVGRLSGGQRKRAALAAELLCRPGILFVDEVTSGLDEMTDREIMSLFRSIADGGQSVVCVTHALTNVAQQCHEIIVLARFGYLAFQGTPAEALTYFGVNTLGEVYSLLAVDEPEQARTLAARFQAHRAAAQSNSANPAERTEVLGDSSLGAGSGDDAASDGQPGSQSRPVFSGAWSFSAEQLRVLQVRDWTRSLVDSRSMVMRMLQSCLVAYLLSTVFHNAMSAPLGPINCAHILLVSCFWFGCNSAAKEIVRERRIFDHELRLGLNPLSYLMSKFCVLGIWATAQSWLVIAVVQWRLCLSDDHPSWFFLGMLTAVAGSAVGLAISAWARCENSANAAVPMVIIPQILLAGAATKLVGINLGLAWSVVASYSGLQVARTLLGSDKSSGRAPVMVDDYALLVVQTLLCLVLAHYALRRPRM